MTITKHLFQGEKVILKNSPSSISNSPVSVSLSGRLCLLTNPTSEQRLKLKGEELTIQFVSHNSAEEIKQKIFYLSLSSMISSNVKKLYKQFFKKKKKKKKCFSKFIILCRKLSEFISDT